MLINESKKCLFNLYLLFIFLKYSFSIMSNLYFEIFCVDDYVIDIKSSEGIIKPKNPSFNFEDLSYTYLFPEIHHNLEELICINLSTEPRNGYFSFKKFIINEYNLTFLQNEDLFICDKYNYNTKNKFYYDGLCYNRPLIQTSYGANKISFCIKPINDFSILNDVGENNINKNYYILKKDIKYILNEDLP